MPELLFELLEELRELLLEPDVEDLDVERAGGELLEEELLLTELLLLRELLELLDDFALLEEEVELLDDLAFESLPDDLVLVLLFAAGSERLSLLLEDALVALLRLLLQLLVLVLFSELLLLSRAFCWTPLSTDGLSLVLEPVEDLVLLVDRVVVEPREVRLLPYMTSLRVSRVRAEDLVLRDSAVLDVDVTGSRILLSLDLSSIFSVLLAALFSVSLLLERTFF